MMLSLGCPELIHRIDEWLGTGEDPLQPASRGNVRGLAKRLLDESCDIPAFNREAINLLRRVRPQPVGAA
jgi:hypothetical protein